MWDQYSAAESPRKTQPEKRCALMLVNTREETKLLEPIVARFDARHQRTWRWHPEHLFNLDLSARSITARARWSGNVPRTLRAADSTSLIPRRGRPRGSFLMTDNLVVAARRHPSADAPDPDPDRGTVPTTTTVDRTKPPEVCQ